MTDGDRERLERDLKNIMCRFWLTEVDRDEIRSLVSYYLIQCGWRHGGVDVEEAESADALEAIPTAAVQPVERREVPSPPAHSESKKRKPIFVRDTVEGRELLAMIARVAARAPAWCIDDDYGDYVECATCGSRWSGGDEKQCMTCGAHEILKDGILYPQPDVQTAVSPEAVDEVLEDPPVKENLELRVRLAKYREVVEAERDYHVHLAGKVAAKIRRDSLRRILEEFDRIDGGDK